MVSHEEWLAARTAFLAKEKEFSGLRDELSRQRRELPWEAVEKASVFEGQVHLNQRDATMIAVSRAPYSKLAAYQKRMGWNFRWVSSAGNDFDFDYRASFTPEEVAPKGRDDGGRNQYWVRRHDEYGVK